MTSEPRYGPGTDDGFSSVADVTRCRVGAVRVPFVATGWPVSFWSGAATEAAGAGEGSVVAADSIGAFEAAAGVTILAGGQRTTATKEAPTTTPDRNSAAG